MAGSMNAACGHFVARGKARDSTIDPSKIAKLQQESQLKAPAADERKIWPPRSVLVYRDGSWQPTEPDVVILLVHDCVTGYPFDSIAWRPEQPQQWWQSTGLATHLGEADRRCCCWDQSPIRLVATPKEWATTAAPRACVLDWTADLRALFGEVPEVRCASAALRLHLQKQLVAQTMPRFRVTST
jgi:hypothetical protein